MKLLCTAGTDIGKERANNEDAYLVDESLGLYVVCDGMGGHQYGEIASANASEFIRDGIRERAEDFRRFADGELTTKDVRAILRSVLENTNYKLREMAVSDETLEGMGTTAVVVLVLGSHAFLGHVGDSRIYLFRDNAVHMVTDDHSIGSEVQKKTSLPREYRAALTRALGVHDTVEPDVLSLDLFPGDGILLSSDGLYSYFTPRKLRDAQEEIGADKTEDFLSALIAGALERGGRDNITGVYLYVEDDPNKKPYVIARKKLEIIQALSLFRFLTFTELLHLTNIASAERFNEGDEIFQEAAAGEALFVILRGEVAIYKGGVELAQLSDGDHFGEMALIDKSPRSASVKALRDTVCLVIDRGDFYDLLRDLPNLAVKVLWSFVKELSARLRETSDELSIARSLIKQNAEAPAPPMELSETDLDVAPPPLPTTSTFANMPAITPELVQAEIERAKGDD
jgi:PPM family protein phosphatase